MDLGKIQTTSGFSLKSLCCDVEDVWHSTEVHELNLCHILHIHGFSDSMLCDVTM